MLELKELARLVRELAQERAELHELKRELNKDYTAEDLRVMDELDAEAEAAAAQLEAQTAELDFSQAGWWSVDRKSLFYVFPKGNHDPRTVAHQCSAFVPVAHMTRETFERCATHYHGSSLTFEEVSALDNSWPYFVYARTLQSEPT
jgi:hypothetical protein